MSTTTLSIWIFVFFWVTINYSNAVLPPQEISAMKDLLNGVVPAGLWNTPDVNDPCTWAGVSCSNVVDDHISTIILNFNVAFQLSIPDSLANVTLLGTLVITNATLTSRIPAGLSVYLMELTSVKNIQWPTFFPVLFYCDIVDSTMESLLDLQTARKLVWLNIRGGSLTDTSFNMNCSTGHSVAHIGLSQLRLTAPFPDLTNCRKIISLTVEMAGLTGTFPMAQISSVQTIETLNLGGNQLTGGIPEEITGLRVLQNLFLSSNQLSGNIPEQLPAMPKMRVLDLHSNQFSGSIPDRFLPSIYYVTVSQNNLTGTVPKSLALATNLDYLDLSDNFLTGGIPAFQIVPPTRFDLSNNRLTGMIPNMFLKSSYSVIDLSSNRLTGTIPRSLYQALNITTELKLANNALGGCVESATFGPPPSCDLSGNFFCCKSDVPMCSVTTNCRTCTTPKPTENATCIVDEDGNPVWLVDGNLDSTSSITLDGVTVSGNLTITGELTVNGGIITVQECAFVNGSLTLNLTPEEITALSQNGTITRALIQYNALCDESSVKFTSITVLGDVECTELKGYQQNLPGLVSIVITSTPIDCPDKFPDWAIGVIVAGACVIAGVILTAVLVTRHKALQVRNRTLSNNIRNSTATLIKK